MLFIKSLRPHHDKRQQSLPLRMGCPWDRLPLPTPTPTHTPTPCPYPYSAHHHKREQSFSLRIRCPGDRRAFEALDRTVSDLARVVQVLEEEDLRGWE